MTKLWLPNGGECTFVCPYCGANDLVEGAHDSDVDWPASYLEVDSVAFDGQAFHVDYADDDACHSFSPDVLNPGCTEIWYACGRCGASWEANGPEDASNVYWDSIAYQLRAVEPGDDSDDGGNLTHAPEVNDGQ